MTRVKQFADDLGISKNKAQALINKGRSRKDGGSQILEKVMKKPIYAEKGKVVKIKKGDNSKAVLAQFKNLVNASTAGKISPAEAEKKIKKLVLNKKAGGSINKNIVSIDVDKTPGNLSTQKKIQSAIKGKSLKTSDVNKMTNNDIKPLLNKKALGGLQEIPADNKGLRALGKKAPGVVKEMGFKMRGGGIAIQGLGFTGVK